MTRETEIAARVMASEHAIQALVVTAATRQVHALAPTNAQLIEGVVSAALSRAIMGGGRLSVTGAGMRVMQEAKATQIDRYLGAAAEATAEIRPLVHQQLGEIAAALDVSVSLAEESVDVEATDPWALDIIGPAPIERLVSGKLGKMIEVLRKLPPGRTETAHHQLENATKWSMIAFFSLLRTVAADIHNGGLLRLFRERPSWIAGYRWATETEPDQRIVGDYKKVYPLDSSVRPPAHIGSRSVIVPILTASAVERQASVA
jgi:hypothetical protein